MKNLYDALRYKSQVFFYTFFGELFLISLKKIRRELNIGAKSYTRPYLF